MIRRLLYAKNVVLWLLVTPRMCRRGAGQRTPQSLPSLTVYTVVAIGVLPFGILAVSAWVGILFPYHPMPLRYRWEHRRPHKRMLVRWGILVVTPYVLVPVLGSLMLTPSLLLWGFTAPHGLSEKLPDHDLGLGIAVAVRSPWCVPSEVSVWAWHWSPGGTRSCGLSSDPVTG